MSEELFVSDEDQTGSESAQPPVFGPSRFLPALILSVLVAVVVGGYFLYQRSSSGAWLGRARPPRIAFMSDGDDNWEIYVMDRDGSNLTNLTNNPGADGVPLHAPGQDQLVFASDRDGSGLDLFLMDLDGGNATNITQTPNTNEIPITLSPDGDHVVFVSDQNGSTEIFSVKTAGGELLNLSERERAQSFDDWSSKTDQFIVSAESDTGLSLLITNLAGDIHQTLTDGSYPSGGGRWSPDGQKVSFMAITPEATSIDIYVVDVADGEPVNLTHSASNDRFPRWSPDGSKIAFTSDQDGNSEIYVMDADGSNPTNLTNNAANESLQGDFAWSPDGTQILFHSDRDGNLEVYVMNTDGSNQMNLTNSPGADISAIWVE
jgi:Tol biopolymer transport system component